VDQAVAKRDDTAGVADRARKLCLLANRQTKRFPDDLELRSTAERSSASEL
jgi:hypothetical protein